MDNLNLIEKEMKDIDKNIQSLKKRHYLLNKDYIKLKQEECKKHIGRCFVKKGCYYMIIDTDEIISSLYGGPSFNQYQYKVISFEYPYNNSLKPITSNKIYFNFEKNKLNDKNEITKEEFMLKFEEVNQQWLKKLNEL